jgi:hypothetical protein
MKQYIIGVLLTIIIFLLLMVGRYASMAGDYKYAAAEALKSAQTTITLLEQCAVDLQYAKEERQSAINEILESFELIDIVDVTMYNPVPEQTNSEPLITASGANIVFDYATEHKWIAISWDLHERYGGPLKFGDLVYLKGTDTSDGVYQVQDLMNSRWTSRVDVLHTVGSPLFNYSGAQLYRIEASEDNMLYQAMIN